MGREPPKGVVYKYFFWIFSRLPLDNADIYCILETHGTKTSFQAFVPEIVMPQGTADRFNRKCLWGATPQCPWPYNPNYQGRCQMQSQREKAIQRIIIFMRNRMSVSTRSLEDVLTLAQEHDILLEDVLKYWKEQVFNV